MNNRPRARRCAIHFRPGWFRCRRWNRHRRVGRLPVACGLPRRRRFASRNRLDRRCLPRRVCGLPVWLVRHACRYTRPRQPKFHFEFYRRCLSWCARDLPICRLAGGWRLDRTRARRFPIRAWQGDGSRPYREISLRSGDGESGLHLDRGEGLPCRQLPWIRLGLPGSRPALGSRLGWLSRTRTPCGKSVGRRPLGDLARQQLPEFAFGGSRRLGARRLVRSESRRGGGC
jgi:hypothetical protein